MSYFGDFQSEELSLILSIPYRAGVWVSHIDDVTGTSRDDHREDIVLEKTLRKIKGKVDPESFVSEIIQEILTHKSEWAFWEERALDVLDDIPKAVKLVRDRLPASEAVSYQKCIFHIAKTVALAVGEGDAESEDLSRDVMGSKLLTKVVDWMSVKAGDVVPENISSAEQDALKRLLQCLKG